MGRNRREASLLVKRGLDTLLAAGGLIVFLPLIVATAGLIRLHLGAPILFRQDRVGLNGRIFRLHKFRSMSDQRDATGMLLPDTQRLTRMGRWLRATSIDELPSLWNVLVGDMSLVGPRPLLPEYLAAYTATETKRHSMRPGVTGLAQVHGRNRVNWDKRLRLDVAYVTHWSLVLDIRILIATVTKVLTREGVEPDHGGTMERLDDSRSRPAMRVDAQQENKP